MPLEYVNQTYYPGCRATLFIRFDEFNAASSNVASIKKLSPITQIKGTNDPRGNLKVAPDPAAPAGTTKFLLLPPTAKVTGGTDPFERHVGPFADEESEDGLTHRLHALIPRKAEWKQNGIRTADTLSLEFRWMDMPLDPRVIRSCAVKLYLGALSPSDFARGIQGEIRAGSKRPMNLLPDTFFDVHGNPRSNLRFLGWVDKWEMTWSDNEPVVRLECTDNTRLLLKQPQPARAQVNGKKPIDEAVSDYLAQFPQLGGISVEYRPAELTRDKIPTLNKVLAGTANVPDLGPPSKGAGGGEDDSVWDYLDTVVGAIGHTIRIDGTSVIIQQATSLLDGRAQPRLGDPYQTRLIKGRKYDVRTFIWGRNISEIKVHHDYTRPEAKGIEARCYLPKRKKTLVARFPQKGDRPTHPLPGDKGDAHWQVVRVSGIEDEVTLKRAAEDYYNNLFRNELGLTVKTRNLASFGGGDDDPDILDMKPGDNFRVEVARGEGASVQGVFEADEPNDLIERLTSMGYSPAFANAYALTYLSAGFQTLYRAREITVTWDTEEGINIELTGHNYVEVRVDKPNPNDPTSIPSGRK